MVQDLCYMLMIGITMMEQCPCLKDNAADRDFNVTHGTIVATNSNDFL